MKTLEGKIALITGASKGIGRAIANTFAEQGASIAFTYLSSVEQGESLVERLKAKGVDAKGYRSDASNLEAAQELITDVIQDFGKFDILINNAGITRDNLTIRMKDEEWSKVININLSSSFLLSKNVIKKMIRNKNGKIINITSIVGHTGNVGQANYAASKAGLIGMSKSLALEYGKKNIKINCISPGFIKSEMTDKISDNFKQLLQDKISLERFGDPSDVANAVLFLSSSLSDYITGETIHVNGGMYFS